MSNKKDKNTSKKSRLSTIAISQECHENFKKSADMRGMRYTPFAEQIIPLGIEKINEIELKAHEGAKK